MPRIRDQAWEKIFAVKGWKGTGPFTITADEIKAITNQEPRLMAKFDMREDRPLILQQRGLFILPVQDGVYKILPGEGYHDLEPLSTTQEFVSRVAFSLYSLHRGIGEMQHLDYAYNCGLLGEIVGDHTLYLAARGRKRSGAFRLRVEQEWLEVEGVQIEIDAGYEGRHSIVLIEGKIRKSPYGNFIIRQLYYPYRDWTESVKVARVPKTVVPFFFIHEPGTETYNFWRYSFADLLDYGSIHLVSSSSHRIVWRPDNTQSQILKIQPDAKLEGIIPQADSLSRVVELVFRVSEGLDNSKAIAEHFGFDRRQSSYYREAAESLGLVRLEPDNRYVLTDEGKQFVALPTPERYVKLASLIIAMPIMKRVIEAVEGRLGQWVTNEEIAQIIAQHSHIGGSTAGRRTQTIKSWLKWLSKGLGWPEVDAQKGVRMRFVIPSGG
ncbi:MAG: AAA-associated domain-containing protein [Chloroflexi bacterium]|nr:AAA-associated domain-containing protein [Chloroflexota bacterium]